MGQSLCDAPVDDAMKCAETFVSERNENDNDERKSEGEVRGYVPLSKDILLSLVRRWGTGGVDPHTLARNFSAFRLCCLVLRCSPDFFLVAAFTLSSAESNCSNPP